MAKKPATPPSDDDLLDALNRSNASAAAEAAEPAPADTIELPEGPMKIIIVLNSLIVESIDRNKLLPATLVYVRDDDTGKLTHYYVHDVHGPQIDTVLNLGNHLRGILPDRLPQTSGMNATDFLSGNPLPFWRQTRGPVTLFLKPREVEVIGAKKIEAVHKQPIGYAELPALASFEFITPNIGAFVEEAHEAIVEAHAAGKYGLAVGAAHALNAVAHNLVIVDKMPPAKKPQRDRDHFDPTGASTIVRAFNDAQLPTTALTEGYMAALKLLGAHAIDPTQRTTCEQGGELLAALRDHLRHLTA